MRPLTLTRGQGSSPHELAPHQNRLQLMAGEPHDTLRSIIAQTMQSRMYLPVVRAPGYIPPQSHEIIQRHLTPLKQSTDDPRPIIKSAYVAAPTPPPQQPQSQLPGGYL